MKKQFYFLMTLLVVVSFAFTSCNQTFYQVYDVNSNTLKQQDNALVYENSDLKVMYNLWGKNGRVGFIVQNKTASDLFIDLGQTFFIINGAANDYFKNREYTTSTSESSSLQYSFSASYLASGFFWPENYYVPVTESVTAKLLKGRSRGVTTKEQQVICVPAHAFKVISEYKVSPKFIKTCNKDKDFPKQTANVGYYSESDSPIKFVNRIAYSFDKDVKNVQFLNHDFYVTGVTNYSKKAAVEKVKEKVDCYDSRKTKIKRFKIGGPNKFYKTYDVSKNKRIVVD